MPHWYTEILVQECTAKKLRQSQSTRSKEQKCRSSQLVEYLDVIEIGL